MSALMRNAAPEEGRGADTDRKKRMADSTCDNYSVSQASELPPNAVTAEDPASRLHALFAGNENFRGSVPPDTGPPRADGKVQPSRKPQTLHEAPTVPHWREHLTGRQGLGVCPIRDDDTCVWGCLDVDVYDLDLAALDERIKAKALPLVMCRSKSGGAHLYLLAEAAVPAATMRAALQGMLQSMSDIGSIEVFPKQAAVGSGRAGGNWLNMPYLGGDPTNRYCVKRGGLAMSVEEFVDYAESSRVSVDEIERLATASPPARTSRPSPGAAPTGRRATPEEAEAILLAGCEAVASAAKLNADDTLNKVAFGLGALHRDTGIERNRCEDMLRVAWGRRGKSPADFREVWPHAFDEGATSAEGAGAYLSWMGGRSAGASDIQRIVRVVGGEEVQAEVFLRGHREPIVVSPMGRLMRHNLFAEQCLEQALVVLQPMRPADWAAVLEGTPTETRQIERDVSVAGMFFDALRQFVYEYHKRGYHDAIDGIVNGGAFYNEDEERFYFLTPGLMAHLGRTGVPLLQTLKPAKFGRLLNALGGDTIVGTRKMNIKGRPLDVRWVARSVFEAECGPPEPLGLPPLPPQAI